MATDSWGIKSPWKLILLRKTEIAHGELRVPIISGSTRLVGTMGHEVTGHDPLLAPNGIFSGLTQYRTE